MAEKPKKEEEQDGARAVLEHDMIELFRPHFETVHTAIRAGVATDGKIKIEVAIQFDEDTNDHKISVSASNNQTGSKIIHKGRFDNRQLTLLG